MVPADQLEPMEQAESNAQKRWYVVQTNPREEARALRCLGEKGVEVFFPRVQVMQYRAVKVGLVVRPMFPSYLFARFRGEEEFPYVLWTRGVKRVLGAEGHPLPVDDEVVSFIRGQVDSRGVVKVGRRLRAKDRVRIRSGPFKDLLGIFEREIDDAGRVEILLNLIGYQARVQLHESLVERMP
jgi:transcriptional antiterminator RfaH